MGKAGHLMRANHGPASLPGLRARIERRYAVAEELVALRPGLDVHFLRAADPDAVLDEATAEEDRGGRQVLPYWAEVWESARVLADSFATPPAANPLRVLDLGCGMGLAGTCAAAAGHRVLLADLETPALLFARYNAVRSAADPRSVRVRRVDWRADDLGERFDLIVGADVLYDRAEWPFLLEFWRRHLAAGGKVLLGEPGRQTGREFTDQLAGWGWTSAETAAAARGTAVRVLTLRPTS